MQKNNKKAFTLAEVLITLGIIGIVAALTIPQLMKKTANAHLGAELANAVSTIENAAGMYFYDNNVKNATLLGKTTASDLVGELAGTYLKSRSHTITIPDVTCGQSIILPSKSVVCATSANLGSGATNLYVVSSASLKNSTLMQGFDYFGMALDTDGHIYLPGLDYSTDAACSETDGGAGCIGRIAKNGWKVDY